ncbi:ribonuclease Z [Pasteuria penetrans]|uniref:ribonuclease Z n=1 Tax=Pasteuria penetrans TaxID=86005 RepID=UPI000FA9FC0C|nr:ribonuclease Z [Pasteuria penetrans]
MQLHFLGTGAGCPTLLRNVSALALQMPEQGGIIWLFDCGEGTQHRIHASPLRLPKLTHIFITHLHGDHVFGLPGILSSRASQGATEPLTLYGPEGITNLVETILRISSTRLRYPLSIIEWKDGDVFLEPPFALTIAELEHGIPSFGIRLDEYPARPGSLNTEKLQSHGIPAGPLYGQLKKQELTLLPNGNLLRREDFLLPSPPPRCLVICGDTRPSPTTVQLAHKTQILVHEATYRHSETERAERFYHSTSIEAARVAREAGIRTLLLNHLSARYDREAAQELLMEARSIFPNTEVAFDGWSYPIPQQRRAKKGETTTEDKPK